MKTPIDFHDALREVVQMIYDQTGVQVLGVAVEWVDVSTMEKQRRIATVIRTDAQTSEMNL